VSRDADRPWWLPLAAATGALLVRALGRTWRVEIVGREGFERVQSPSAEPCIFALWHARLLPFLYLHRGCGAAVLVSRSRDGELIASALTRLGFVVARGSSTRGGHEGLMELLRFGGEGRGLGVTPDGPRGPAETLKPGLVALASRSGLPVVPVASAARAAWVAHSWDGFRVPWPFARVVAGYGEPLHLPAGLDEASAETWRLRFEEVLRAHTRAIAARAGEAP
jgi:hypothetical protein